MRGVVVVIQGKSEPPVRERVRLVRSTAEEAARVLDDSSYDVVICHGVIMHLEGTGPLGAFSS